MFTYPTTHNGCYTHCIIVSEIYVYNKKQNNMFMIGAHNELTKAIPCDINCCTQWL